MMCIKEKSFSRKVKMFLLSGVIILLLLLNPIVIEASKINDLPLVFKRKIASKVVSDKGDITKMSHRGASPIIYSNLKNISDEVLLEIDIDEKKHQEASEMPKVSPYINYIKRHMHEAQGYIDFYNKNKFFRNFVLDIKEEDGKMVADYMGVKIIKDSILTSSSSYKNNYMIKDQLIDEYIKDYNFMAVLDVIDSLDLDEDILEGIKIHISPHPYKNSIGLSLPDKKEISLHISDLYGPPVAKYISVKNNFAHELWHTIEPYLIKDYKKRYNRDLINDYADYYEKFANGRYKKLLSNSDYIRSDDIYEAIATDFAIYANNRIKTLLGEDMSGLQSLNSASMLRYNPKVTNFFDKVLYDR